MNFFIIHQTKHIMASFNKVILIGNLTRDPELRYTPKGTAIARLGLAVNRSWRTETGEQREEVSFLDIDAFGKQAEIIGEYLRKGSPLMVEGRLKMDSWDDKTTGQKRSRLLVVLESFQFLDSKSDRSGGGRDSGSGSSFRSGSRSNDSDNFEESSSGSPSPDYSTRSGRNTPASSHDSSSSGGGDFDSGMDDEDDVPF